MNAFFALIRKDLRLYFTNRRALLVNLALPIVIAAFFGVLFGNGGGEKRKTARIPIAVVDQDRSPISTALVKAIGEDATLDVQSLPEADAIDQVRRGKMRAAVVIPEKFGAEAPRALFGAGTKPQITVHFDPSQSMVMAMVRGLLAQHAMRAVTQTAFSAEGATKVFGDFRSQVSSSRDIDEGQKRDLLTMFDSIERVQSRPEPAADKAAGKPGAKPAFDLPFATRELEVASGGDRKYNSFSHSLAGMSVQFMLFLGIEFGVNLLLARRMGLWKRLRAAPLSRATLLGATIAGGTLITAIMLTIIYLIGMVVFGLRIDGSVAGFFGVVLAFALFTATFGLLIAAVGNTPEASRGIAVFATLILVMLGGAWVPSFVFPEWLQSATLAVPTRWAIDGLAAMTWRGLGIESALAPMGVLLLFAAAFSAIALWRFKWEE